MATLWAQVVALKQSLFINKEGEEAHVNHLDHKGLTFIIISNYNLEHQKTYTYFLLATSIPNTIRYT